MDSDPEAGSRPAAPAPTPRMASANDPPSDASGGGEERDGDRSRERLRLRGGGAIEFVEYGFRVIEPRGLKRSPTHLYESLTHVALGASVLLIGTTSGLITLRHADFPDPVEGPETAKRLLLERLASTPDGPSLLREMERVEALADRGRIAWVIWGTVALCLAATALQLADPNIRQIGAFLPELFWRGEYWRAVTSHLLHGLPYAPPLMTFLFGPLAQLPFHLAFNVAGLLVLGHLVERPLGSLRTAIVLGASACGSIAGVLYAGHVDVIGASGLVAGLAGAMLALELHYSSALPSYWRLPRRLLIVGLLLQFLVLDQILARFIAGGAHLGGFAGGYLGAWLLGRPRLEELAPRANLRMAAASAALLLLAGLLSAVPLARREPGALERHAARLLNTPPAFYLQTHENAAAWLIAIEEGSSDYALDLAVALATRAVTTTQRAAPGYLDTLAEALFQRGDLIGAVLTIDEAIRLAPYEPYFFEQRRRFTGERAADDRPPPPGSRPPEPERDDLPIDPDAPRVMV